MRLIDADALLERMKKAMESGSNLNGTFYLHIEHAPTITRPTGKWIPVSERLPKARESVILSTKECTGEGCYWETTKDHVIWKGYRWNATYWDDEVIAWMPLPPVYQGE